MSFIEILNNGMIITPDLDSGPVAYTGVTLTKETSPSNKTVYQMTFSAGLVVGTSVNFGLLELLVSASADLKSTCTGKSFCAVKV